MTEVPVDQQTQTQATTQVAAPAPVEVKVDGLTAEQWKAKYNGLNGVAIDRLNKLAEKDQILTQKEQEIADFTTKYQSAQQLAAQAQTERDQHKAQVAALKREKTIGSEITTKYPTLAALYSEGLLLGVENLDDEARKTYLDKYAAKIATQAETQQRQETAGAVPPPPAERNPAQKTLEQISKDMETALKTKGQNSPEYQKSYDEYIRLSLTSDK